MAIYFLRSKHISRSNGSRVTRAAAYRAGERIRNEGSSEVFDYSSRRDISYEAMVLPADLAGRDDMAWTQDRSTLWNAAEHAGLRCNSRLAREWLVFPPPELTPDQRHQLVRSFAKELADRYRAAVRTPSARRCGLSQSSRPPADTGRIASEAARRWKEIYDAPKDRKLAPDSRENTPQRDGADSTDPRSPRREHDLER